MLLILYVLDSLFFATPKSKRVLMHVWRHMLLTLWFVDSLFFATPKSKRVLMGTKVGGEVHGEGQRKRKSADGGRGVLVFYFSGFTRRSRSVFLYLYGVLEGQRHGVILLSSVRCLRR